MHILKNLSEILFKIKIVNGKLFIFNNLIIFIIIYYVYNLIKIDSFILIKLFKKNYLY
jgi:hypothetical protein